MNILQIMFSNINNNDNIMYISSLSHFFLFMMCLDILHPNFSSIPL